MKRILAIIVIYLFTSVCWAGSPLQEGHRSVIAKKNGASVSYVDGTGANVILATGEGPQTWSYTSGNVAAGNNTLLVVGVLGRAPDVNEGVISGITYNGVSLSHGGSTPLYATGEYDSVDVWYLTNPTTDGSAHDMVISYSVTTTATGVVVAAIFKGVNQSSPLGTAVTGTTLATGTGISVTVPESGAAIVFTGTGSSLSSPNQTLISNNTAGAYCGGGQYSTTSGSQSFTWTGVAMNAVGYPINH